jgi:ketosteroid isomerase-like protein
VIPKILAVLVAGLLVGGDVPKDNAAPKEVQKAVTALNTAFERRDANAIGRLMTDDHVSVTAYYGGPMSKAQQLASLPDLNLSEYAAGKLRVLFLSKDVALVTYSLTQKGTFKGKEVPLRNYASAIWVNRDGKWLEAFYQDTPVEGK